MLKVIARQGFACTPRLRLSRQGFACTPRLRLDHQARYSFPPWLQIEMLLTFVKARLNYLRLRKDQDKDTSTVALLESKLKTYKLGFDEAAEIQAAILESDAMSPGCVDKCVDLLDNASGQTPPATQGFACAPLAQSQSAPDCKKQKNMHLENYLTQHQWEYIADLRNSIQSKVYVFFCCRLLYGNLALF